MIIIIIIYTLFTLLLLSLLYTHNNNHYYYIHIIHIITIKIIFIIIIIYTYHKNTINQVLDLSAKFQPCFVLNVWNHPRTTCIVSGELAELELQARFFDVVRLGWVLNRIYDDSAKELDCGMTKSQNNWIYPNFVVVVRNKNVGLEWDLIPTKV